MRRIIALICLLVLPANGFAWNSFGHMAVAWIAYQHLNPNTKSLVDSLIAKNPSYKTWKASLPPGITADQRNLYLFMIAATWPDQIRGDKSYHDEGGDHGNRPPDTGGSANLGYGDKARHKYWHFIDVPFTQDATPLGLVPTPNLETEVAVFRQTLSSKATLKLKSYDLAWLIHLIGDVHQPLHCSSRYTTTQPTGDAGGNLVKFCSATATTCSDNLHGFWDGLLGPTSAKPEDVAAVATTLSPVEVKPDDLDTHTWVDESFDLARTVVYANPPVGDGAGPFQFNQAYADNAKLIAQRRVMQAGLRLANILNTDLK